MIDENLNDDQRALLESVPLRPASEIRHRVVDYESDGHPLQGYLAWDESGEGLRSAVLILPDWTGAGPMTVMRAQMVARQGHVVLVAGIYDRDVHPTGEDAAAEAGRFYGDLAALRARVQAGYEQLVADDRVDPARIVVIGYCFGGSAALEFARTGADLAGTVTFHGGLIAHDPSDAAAIRSPLLVLTGGADDVVPDSAVVAWQDELRAAPGVDWEVVTYSGAPHAFTLPGTPSYRDTADARSWARFGDYLAEVLS